MRNDNIDNDKLMKEIESLDDDREETIDNNLKTKRWPIILGIIALIGLGILYFGDEYFYDFFYEVNEEYSERQIENYMEQEEIEKDKFEQQKNNITISNSYLNYNKELIAVISNDNDNVINDLKIEVIFYDEENKPIEIDSSDISIMDKNSECYVKFVNTPESFERYDFLISKEK